MALPPHISNIKRDMLPFMRYLEERGVKQVVFMTIQGAEHNKVVLHRAVEDYLVKLGLPYTIVRPSFFMSMRRTTISRTRATELATHQLLEVMESVGVLRIVRLEDDRNARSVGQKLLFSDPAYYPVLHGNSGTAREALVASLCAFSGWSVEAAKDERAADFVLTSGGDRKPARLLIEVGGASKSRKSADFVIRDDIEYPGSGVVPLWLLGMGY